MKTHDTYYSREHCYGLGYVEESGRHYLSIPVSIRVVDYDEFYGLSPQEFHYFGVDQTAAVAFADECRLRLQDDRLLQQPGWNRGSPILPPPPGIPIPPPPPPIRWRREGPKSIRADVPPPADWFGPPPAPSSVAELLARRAETNPPAEQIAIIAELAKLGDFTGRDTLVSMLNSRELETSTALEAQRLLLHLARERDFADVATFAYLDADPPSLVKEFVGWGYRMLARSAVERLLRGAREDEWDLHPLFVASVSTMIGRHGDDPAERPTIDVLTRRARLVLNSTDADYLDRGTPFTPTALIDRKRQSARRAYALRIEHPSMYGSWAFVPSLAIWTGRSGPYFKSVELTEEDLQEIDRYTSDLDNLAWQSGHKYFYGHDVDGGPGLIPD